MLLDKGFKISSLFIRVIFVNLCNSVFDCLSFLHLFITFTFVLILLIGCPSYSLNQCEFLFSDFSQNKNDFAPQVNKVIQENNIRQVNDDLLEIQPEKIFSEGKKSSSKILFLKKEQLGNKNYLNRISSDTILILDDFPTDFDLPLVAGIIIINPLKNRKTHNEKFAKSMSIPLIMCPEFSNSKTIQDFTKKWNFYELNCSGGICQLRGSLEPLSEEAVFQSVYPLFSTRRNTKELISSLNASRYSYEEAGNKFLNLVNFKNVFPDLVPDIVSISSGYYLKFLKQYKVEIQNRSQSLQEFISSKMALLKEANEHHDEKSVEKILTEIQFAIKNAEKKLFSFNLFTEISEKLTKYFKYLGDKLKYSIRSNNDVEEFLVPGLYESLVANSLNINEIENKFRSIWASLFDYRAYKVRRTLGQLEENLTMPVLIHPYIENDIAHAIGSFKIVNKNTLELSLDLVLSRGNHEHATSPSENARTFQIVVSENKSMNGNTYTSYKVFKSNSQFELPSEIKSAIVPFMNRVSKYITADILQKKFPLSSIEVELVLVPSLSQENKLDIQVLQYKPEYSKEILYAILTGELKLQDVDETIKYEPYYSPDDTYLNLKKYGFSLLREVNLNDPGFRYALVEFGNKMHILVWKKTFHRDAKKVLENLNIRWITSGYINATTLSFSSFFNHPTLDFTDPNNSYTDLDLSQSEFDTMFLEALQSEVAAYPNLIQDFNRNQPLVLFETLNGNSLFDSAHNFELVGTSSNDRFKKSHFLQTYL